MFTSNFDVAGLSDGGGIDGFVDVVAGSKCGRRRLPVSLTFLRAYALLTGA